MSSTTVRLLRVLFLLQAILSVVADHDSNGRGCMEREREALLKLKNGVTEDPHLLHRLSSWVGDNCCTWFGVVCRNVTGHVIELSLPNPDGINDSSALIHLTYVDFTFRPVPHPPSDLVPAMIVFTISGRKKYCNYVVEADGSTCYVDGIFASRVMEPECFNVPFSILFAPHLWARRASAIAASSDEHYFRVLLRTASLRLYMMVVLSTPWPMNSRCVLAWPTLTCSPHTPALMYMWKEDRHCFIYNITLNTPKLAAYRIWRSIACKNIIMCREARTNLSMMRMHATAGQDDGGIRGHLTVFCGVVAGGDGFCWGSGCEDPIATSLKSSCTGATSLGSIFG
ncbi:hypothetical protein H6P81_017003 [Aristolochia fimbriata]|uniref:Leucine-rich repeat-containing N-terminal plant-type domain-containing protein n=1 Tax=Aristolochia fimbriata TaxID=158543 RepID=A0AAV7DXZ5_ARIFI|nr:hypothetical protein H6P81_017003 [Aristolochia fimbriata]